jgi:hypothetical protein
MSYNILDAIRDEIAFCRQAQKVTADDMPVAHVFYREQAVSLSRILDRLETGTDYILSEKPSGDPIIKRIKTNRKSDEVLERENIALKKAGENYRMIKVLVNNEEKETTK